MPGNSFGSGSSTPPRAQGTMLATLSLHIRNHYLSDIRYSTHLLAIAAQEPSPASPSVASVSSLSTLNDPASGQATTQQILIAHLLLTLLSAGPTFAMGLNKLKEAVSSKVGGIAGQGVTRALYGCVAKRVLKIERGGGEQVVKFDV